MTVALGDPARHFFLTRAVARSMGISLTEALTEGRLTPQVYSAMVTNCRACALVEACEDWLGRQGGGASTPLPGCRNGAELVKLRAG